MTLAERFADVAKGFPPESPIHQHFMRKAAEAEKAELTPERADEEALTHRALMESRIALRLVKEMMANLMAKGNVNWGSTFGIDFGLMNQALLAQDAALTTLDKVFAAPLSSPKKTSEASDISEDFNRAWPR